MEYKHVLRHTNKLIWFKRIVVEITLKKITKELLEKQLLHIIKMDNRLIINPNRIKMNKLIKKMYNIITVNIIRITKHISPPILIIKHKMNSQHKIKPIIIQIK